MSIPLSPGPRAGGVYGVRVYFYDTDGTTPKTPTAASWSLFDSDEAIVNSLEDVTIGSLDTSVVIGMEGGADLPAGKKWLVVTYTLDSDTLGANKTDVMVFTFLVEDVPG